MSSTLLQNAAGQLSPELVARVSAILGETEGATSKALSRGALPLLLAGIASKSREVGSAERVLALLHDPAFDPRAVQDGGSLLGEGGGVAGLRQLGDRLLTLLFAGRIEALGHALAEFAGIRPASSGSLLRLAAPLVLGVLGDRVERDDLDAAGLARLFGREREDLVAAVPLAVRRASGLEREDDGHVTPVRTGAPAWLWLVLALLGVGVLWALLRAAPQTVAEERPAAELPDVAARPAAGWVTMRLPNGSELRIPDGGIEARLVERLEGGGAPDEWIEFDRLRFASGSSTLLPESQEQLRNVAAILAAYPDAQVKIGGYTDAEGDPAANLELSHNRAASVKSSLVNLGIDADRLEAEGYGDQHPVASNASEEGRARNRRIALRVTSR